MKPFVLNVTTKRNFSTALEAWEFMQRISLGSGSSVVEAYVEIYREADDE